MTRFSRVAIVAGAAVAMAALSEIGPTTAHATPATTTNKLFAHSAPQPTSSCTATFDGSVYSTTVTWSGFSVSSIDVFTSGSSQPIVQEVLGHPTRSGSFTYTTSQAPLSAHFSGPRTGMITRCVVTT